MNLGNLYKRSRPVLLICAMMLLFALPALAVQPGDCSGDGSVTMTEVQGAINMHLGVTAALPCVDADSSGTVTIAELRNAVNGYLGLPIVVQARPVAGLVRDPIANTAATGATVKAYAPGSSTPAATATVLSTGAYSIPGLLAGVSYQFVFSRTGYGDVNYYNVVPSQSADTTLDTVLLIPTASLEQTAEINGYITNAADNTGVASVSLRFRAGMGATSSALLPQTKSTDALGYYSRPAFPAGCYTAEAVRLVDGEAVTLGYFTIYSVPGVPSYNNSQSFTVNAGTGPAGSYRAVLSWGNSPGDLDFHVTGPLNPNDTSTTIGISGTARFHVGSIQSSDSEFTYPYGSGSGTGVPVVPGATTETYLDRDQVEHGVNNGNETITVLTQQPGVYRFYVFNNSTTGSSLAQSGAKVKLYQGTTLLQSFTVPNKTGNTWYVFDLEGSTVTSVNTMSGVLPDQVYNLAKPVPGYPLDELQMFKPIQKTPRTY